MSREHGAAGASAVREGERRRENREQRTLDRHPRGGGLLLALGEQPAHERVWKRGGEGEQLVAQSLAKRCTDAVVLLHDRRVPRSRANIDHIAVAPSGVWVIDTKRHKGKVEIATPLFGSAKLKIAGRDCTGLVAGLADQVQVVRASGAVPEGVPVRGRFCFVEAELPWLGRTIAGLELMHRKSLARALNKPGELNEAAVDSIAAALVTAFPSA